MNQRYLNTGGILGVIFVACAMYIILLRQNILPFSIATMQSLMNHWVTHWHVIAVALLPIYVALVFFGAAVGGLILGSAMQRWVVRLLR